MKISELIESLQDIQTDHGDVYVYIQNLRTDETIQARYAAYNFDTNVAEICYRK